MTKTKTELISITEAGSRIGVSRDTAYRMARRGDFPLVQLPDRKTQPHKMVDVKKFTKKKLVTTRDAFGHPRKELVDNNMVAKDTHGDGVYWGKDGQLHEV